jgi:hypothetical protein
VGTTIEPGIGDETDGPVGGADDEARDVAPVHRSTTRKPKAMRRPHDNSQIRPSGTLASLRSAKGLRPVSTGPLAKAVSPQADSGVGSTPHKT